MRRLFLFLLVLSVAHSARAQVFGTVRVTLRDAQDLALPGATVTLKAEASTWTQTTTADGQGEGAFTAVPIGHYMVTATLSGFRDQHEDIEVTANAIVPVRIKLMVGGLAESVERHTTFDLAAGKDLGERMSLRLSALNVTNALFLTGFENSFAGTHYANPREITGQVKLKFHY